MKSFNEVINTSYVISKKFNKKRGAEFILDWIDENPDSLNIQKIYKFKNALNLKYGTQQGDSNDN